MANIVISGGWGGTEDATESTQKICDAVKDQVEQRTNQKYAVYKAVTFQQQVVAGRNFNIKDRGSEQLIVVALENFTPGTSTRIWMNRTQQDHVRVVDTPAAPPSMKEYPDMVMCGGWGETKDATEETQEICDAVKDQVEQRTNQKYAVYKAVTFRFAVAAGRDLTIKVFAGEEDYIHLSVFYHLPCNGGKVELLNVEEGKTKDDPLGTF